MPLTSEFERRVFFAADGRRWTPIKDKSVLPLMDKDLHR